MNGPLISRDSTLRVALPVRVQASVPAHQSDRAATRPHPAAARRSMLVPRPMPGPPAAEEALQGELLGRGSPVPDDALTYIELGRRGPAVRPARSVALDLFA